MIKKSVLWKGILLCMALFAGSQAHAEAFSELYRSSGLKAFLADGRLLFEQIDSAEQTAKLVCTSEEGRTMWETELPSSVYGGTLLAQAGEELLYACRLPGNNRVTLTRYSQEGRRLSTHTLPEDAGMHLLVDNRVYFISEGALKACNSEGEIQTVSPDDLRNCISLYEAEGNNAAAAFHIRVEKDGKSKHLLVVLNQELGTCWTYDMGKVEVTDARHRLAVSPQGDVSMAQIEGDRTLCFTSFDASGNTVGRKKIVFPEGKGSFITQVRMSSPDVTEIWGSFDISGEIKSWKATLDQRGDAVQVELCPQWVDFVPYVQGHLYGIVDPLGSPVLQREDELEWHLEYQE